MAFDPSTAQPAFDPASATPAFDPVTAKPAQEAPPQGSTWDRVKEAVGGFKADVGKGFGDKSMWELLKTESIPANVVQGVKRVAGGQSPINIDDHKQTIQQELKQIAETGRTHPGMVVGAIGRSIAADPELLLPWLWEAIPEATAIKVAKAAKAMGATTDIADAAGAAGRVAGRVGVGAGVGAVAEGAQQFKTGKFDPGAIGEAALETGAMSLPGKITGKVKIEPDPIVPSVPKEVVEQRLATVDTTREELAKATKDDPITPDLIADVGKEKTPPKPSEATAALVKTIKQATASSAIVAGAGAYFSEDHEKGAIQGAVMGAVLPLLKARKYEGVDIAPIVRARNGQVRTVARHVYQFQNQIEKLVPDKAAREAISERIDTGVEAAVGTPEHQAQTALRQFFDDMGNLAHEHGVVNELRENYISHIVEADDATKRSLLSRLFKPESGGATAGKSGKAFGKERKYDTFGELQAALNGSGLKIKTTDSSEIAGIYANAVYKSVADKQLMDGLKQVKLPDGLGLITDVQKSPPDYVGLASPALAGVRVHPDIAPDLQFVFGQRSPNAVRGALEAVTSASKRVSISLSLFHAKSLAEGYLNASRGTSSVTWRSSLNAAMKTYREGGNNDTLDHLIKNGLIVGTPEDVSGQEVQHVLSTLGDKMNAALPLKGVAGAIPKALAKVDRSVEHFTFGYLQTGMKINVAMSEYEALVRKGVPSEEASRSASSFANDVFGSLDWYRVATDTESHVLRKLGTGALNQNSRKILQLLMFAPDWTAATFRSAAKALPGGARSDAETQVYRRYQLKSAIYYLAVGNAVNYALSGHSIFENKNPTRLELGDGRTMQFAKHYLEAADWLRDPTGTAMNKAAYIPATVFKIRDDNAKARERGDPPPTIVDDAGDALSRFMPISVQQWVQQGLTPESAASALGFPIYGKPRDKGFGQ